MQFAADVTGTSLSQLLRRTPLFSSISPLSAQKSEVSINSSQLQVICRHRGDKAGRVEIDLQLHAKACELGQMPGECFFC